MRGKLLVIALFSLLSLPNFSIAQNNTASAPDAAVENISTDGPAAEPTSDVEMADLMRSNGKIYVVVGVLAIVLAGMLIYLAIIDRKVGKLETEFEQERS